MLSQANIEWISQLSGVSIDEISGALSNEQEVSLDLKLNGRVISQEEEQQLKDDSFKRGSEIRTKDIASSLGVSLDEGEHKKEHAIVAEKIKSALKTKFKTDLGEQSQSDREKELENELKKANDKYETLFETHGKTKDELKQANDRYAAKEKEIKVNERNSLIKKAFPEKMKMDIDDALLIFTNNFQFEENEKGDQVIKRGDKIVTDNVGNPEKLENIVSSFVEEKQWIRVSGMNGSDRGGQSDQNKGGKTPDEAYKIIKEKGIQPTSTEGLRLYNELTA